MTNTDTILHQADVEAVIDARISGKTLRTGFATLVAGEATVLDAAITATSVIRLSTTTLGGAPGALYISAKTADTSFVIKSTSATDTSVVEYDVTYDAPVVAP